jgi:tetratricopeptide (TPR) repeat protein
MKPIYRILAVCLSLALTVLCYLPGLHGGFLFDDIPNIRDNPLLTITNLDIQSLWQAAMSGSAGMLKRPVSMVTFALNYYFSGLDPYYFKATNLAIHLLNGIGIFILSRLLLDLYRKLHRPQLTENSLLWIAIATAALWLLHPFNLSGVLYVVQRMESLSALFTLCGLILYLYGRKRLIEQKSGAMTAILAAVLVFTPLAVLSKENGILLPVFMLVTEATVLHWQTPDKRSRHMLLALFALTVLLPALLVAAYVLLNPAFIIGGYSIRDFSLTERLMTEARVLWLYLHMILLPDIASMGVYHDDIAISRSLFTPATTLPAIAGLLALLTGAVLLRKKYPLLSFGVLFFLAGHSMESTVIGLELVHEHRNYLPTFGILLPLVYYIRSPVCHPSSLRLRRIAMPIVIALFAVLTWLRADQWRDPLGMMQMEVQHHPQSTRANSDLAFQYAYLPATSQLEAAENYQNAIRYYTQAATLSESDTSGFFGILAVNSKRGMPTDPSWADELEKRLEHLPSRPSSVGSLMALEKCLTAGRCTYSQELVERLLRAALRNPTLTGPPRTAVLFALSDFLFEIKKQPEQAAEAAYQAVASAPNDVSERLTLIVFLINMKKLDEAGTELMKARDLDTGAAYSLKLAQLGKQLTEIRSYNILEHER